MKEEGQYAQERIHLHLFVCMKTYVSVCASHCRSQGTENMNCVNTSSFVCVEKENVSVCAIVAVKIHNNTAVVSGPT